MKRWLVAGAAMAAVATLGAGVAGAASDNGPQTFTCNGKTVTFDTHGRTGVDTATGVRYLAYNVKVSGSFDPTDPTQETQTFSDTQWTNASKMGGLQCSAHEVNVTDEGTETFDISLNVLPIGKP